jgi:hypothetical protein
MLRKKGDVKRLADEDVSVRGGADPERMTEQFFVFVSILFFLNINTFQITCPNPVSDLMP